MTILPTVAVIDRLDLADALLDQGVDARVFSSHTGPLPTAETLGELVIAYGDLRIDRANARVLEHLQTCRPMLVSTAPAGLVAEIDAARWVLYGGPPVALDALSEPQRRSIAATCVLEGWATDRADADARIVADEIHLSTASDHAMAAPGAASIGPSTPCWIVRDDATGLTGATPLLHGADAALWLGDDSPEAMRRERVHSEALAPGLTAALRAHGPLDLMALCQRALDMGDDGHTRTDALGTLLVTELLSYLDERAPRAITPVAHAVGGNGGFGLSLFLATATGAVTGAIGTPGSSLVCGLAGTGTDVAVRLFGIPDRWFTAPVSVPLDAAGRTLAIIGDTPLVEIIGFGTATAAPGSVISPGNQPESRTDANTRVREAGVVSIGRSRRLRSPHLDDSGVAVGIDVRACLDAGRPPTIATVAVGRADARGLFHAALRPQPAALTDALGALMYDLERTRPI